MQSKELHFEKFVKKKSNHQYFCAYYIIFTRFGHDSFLNIKILAIFTNPIIVSNTIGPRVVVVFVWRDER